MNKIKILSPSDLKPSRDDFTVECVFNAGVIEFKDEILLLLRVAERPVQDEEEYLKVPILVKNDSGDYRVEIKKISKSRKDMDFSDPRKVFKDKKVIILSSMSHIRIARSKRSELNFKVEKKPFIFPSNELESWGVEDARVTKIEDNYYINYTAVSEKGIATALALTKDFKSVEKKGIIFPPENRDVCFIPEKINGKYYAINRPVPNMIGHPEIWIASSNNMLDWGDYKFLIGRVKNNWESLKIGGGTPFIKTEKGWLGLYHGVSESSVYSMGALLLDLKDPTKVVLRSKTPIIKPTEEFEKNGFFPNVCFSCGMIYVNNSLKIFYGAADKYTAFVNINIDEIWNNLSK